MPDGAGHCAGAGGAAGSLTDLHVPKIHATGPRQISPNDFNMHCATFPRHLGRAITRALITHPFDTVELCAWAYPGQPVNNWMLYNVRQAHLRMTVAPLR